jgi:hypothetical protein
MRRSREKNGSLAHSVKYAWTPMRWGSVPFGPVDGATGISDSCVAVWIACEPSLRTRAESPPWFLSSRMSATYSFPKTSWERTSIPSGRVSSARTSASTRNGSRGCGWYTTL